MHIVRGLEIFKDRTKAINLSTARFDDETRESFLKVYSSFDEKVILKDGILVSKKEIKKRMTNNSKEEAEAEKRRIASILDGSPLAGPTGRPDGRVFQGDEDEEIATKESTASGKKLGYRDIGF